MSLPRDLIDLWAEFDAHHVDYLLVGGHAVAIDVEALRKLP